MANNFISLEWEEPGGNRTSGETLRYLQFDGCTACFSYSTLVGLEFFREDDFSKGNKNIFVSHNHWGPTTGKHINLFLKRCRTTREFAEVVEPSELEERLMKHFYHKALYEARKRVTGNQSVC